MHSPSNRSPKNIRPSKNILPSSHMGKITIEKITQIPTGALKMVRYGTNLHLEPNSPYRYTDTSEPKLTALISSESCESFKSESTHTRHPTMIVNDLNHNRHFVSAVSNIPDENNMRSETSIDFWDYGVGSLDLNVSYDSQEILSDSYEGEKQGPLKSFAQDSTKNSIMQSVVNENKNQPKREFFLEVPKDPNNVRPTLSTHENEADFFQEKILEKSIFSDDPLNFAMSKAYCSNCKTEVFTAVQYKQPSISL